MRQRGLHGTHVMTMAVSGLACITMAVPISGAPLTEAQAGAASALGGFIFATAAFLCGTGLGMMLRSGSSAVLALTTGAMAAATGLIALTLVQRGGRPLLVQPAAVP